MTASGAIEGGGSDGQGRIGIAARFDVGAAPHARTFYRALALTRNVSGGAPGARLVFADDDGTTDGGRRAARHLLDAGVDVVVGHMTSDAALAAAALYDKSGTPLLLPTATATALTEAHPRVLRLCPSDRLLAERLVRHAAASGATRIQLGCEATKHGEQLADDIAEAARAIGLAVNRAGAGEAAETPDNGAHHVFAGAVDTAAAHVRALRHAGYAGQIHLTDDAASPVLAARIGEDAGVSIIGFAPAHRRPEATTFARLYQQHYGGLPGVNAVETSQALQIAASLSRQPCRDADHLRSGRFATSFGTIGFQQGQSLNTAHCIWSIQADGLVAGNPLI